MLKKGGYYKVQKSSKANTVLGSGVFFAHRTHQILVHPILNKS